MSATKRQTRIIDRTDSETAVAIIFAALLKTGHYKQARPTNRAPFPDLEEYRQASYHALEVWQWIRADIGSTTKATDPACCW